ncbi:MAG: OB-fold nucleic acid binding domain-containing protein, partial [Bdellovibrio sp.]
MREYVEDLKNKESQIVTLKGWVYNTRSSGKIRFMQLRDGTGIVQCIFVPSETDAEAFSQFESLTQESSVAVTGLVRKEPRSPGGYELGVRSLKILQISEPYPITPKEHGVEFLMENRHLWLRSKRQHAVLRIRSEIIRAIRDYFDGKGFTLTDAPIFTP